MIDIKAYFDTATNTVTYLVTDKATNHAVLIDPVMDFDLPSASLKSNSIDQILADIKEQAIALEWVLDTHAHADHMSAADYVRTHTGAKIGIGANIVKVQSVFKTIFNAKDVEENGNVFDALFEDGASISFGNSHIKVLHTPGHTPACVSYIIEDSVFVGDTLFMPDYGTARADFPGGDARTLYQSIQKILSLPDDTRIFVGHDYLPEGRDTPQWETSVAQQKSSNIHLQGGNENAFVTMREARDKTLQVPKLILPSLQVNIRAGSVPPAEDDGQSYLKMPINRIA
ncbi:MBL fold metallo-hydrolase [Hirschia baltica]|uniref:Beta-lactamase domain protein n=1 Tax=Hirschia baltica (strain ATCC 49814 / DSM 5838 / IFAM 1418) TaxID=582402 RepID=C6XKN8_HIRBI|nr:MBL fold metallo-hydrolase [Hirschia baltica]ACT59605.1 beta-lactamase domain protein [Hirschia baltica ATCC 49814]